MTAPSAGMRRRAALIGLITMLCLAYCLNDGTIQQSMRSTPDYEMPEQPSHRMLQARDWSWTDKLKRTSDAPIHGGQHETAIYWHIPKSGGTTAKRIYECLGVTLAARVGGQIGNAANDTELKVVQPWINRKAAARPQYTSYVNVDITSKEGIQKARSWGLVESGLVDVIFSPVPVPVIQNLFSDRHQGRGLVVFRNPVERLISKFYYLQVATWEVSPVVIAFARSFIVGTLASRPDVDQ